MFSSLFIASPFLWFSIIATILKVVIGLLLPSMFLIWSLLVDYIWRNMPSSWHYKLHRPKWPCVPSWEGQTELGNKFMSMSISSSNYLFLIRNYYLTWILMTNIWIQKSGIPDRAFFGLKALSKLRYLTEAQWNADIYSAQENGLCFICRKRCTTRDGWST